MDPVMQDGPAQILRSSTRFVDRRAAARDLWPRDTLRWWQGELPPLPERVVWPQSAEQVQQALDEAQDAGQQLIVYGAGSGVCGGARGVEGAVVIDTKGLDRIGPLDTEAWTVRVDAGVIGQNLEDWLAERGFTLGHSPSSIGCSTVGGWAAARSAGQFSSRYGVFEDMVLGLRLATPGRGLLRFGVDGNAPAEWLDQVLGSEGTLGVVTDVTLRVYPLPQKRWLRGYAFDSVGDAIVAMRELMQGELWPAVLRLYDPVDTRIGGKTRPRSEGKSGPSALRRLRDALERLPGAREQLFSLPLSLPRVLNQLADLVAGEVLLIVGWEGEEAVVDTLVRSARPLLEARGRDLGAEPGERWFHSRHAVSYKLMPLFAGGAFADTMEVACPWSQVESVYDAVRASVRKHALVMAHMSHLYPEGGSIYFSFAADGDVGTYDALWKAAQQAVLQAGGTVTHHHGVGRLKRAAACAEVGAARIGWQALRQELDPKGLLHPDLLFVDDVPRVLARGRGSVDDGLVDLPADADLATRRALTAPRELRWPWTSLSGPPRWQRWAWQTDLVEVRGTIDGQAVRLGRGPRSAAGSDLRRFVLATDPEARVRVASASVEERWMGALETPHPWAVVRQLLRADLRPSRVGVVDGALCIGFRGPAAAALGDLCTSLLGPSLRPVGWEDLSFPAAPLVPCADDDPQACWATHQTVWRPAGEDRQ